ncbi:hypothetical protein [Paenarthrobacter nitroguajacolicus]|uniref:hypothetical protein n=1 Tax=Paenarthrobacter nitroguajacolicus TaxID=211146 RepID=UPI00248BEB60|nr:hypothetical protein [Paenarthrobacter nitroguajacolicus]MDI2035342.1 hypothetical protein [Paenarthrobacter nitroguajacolicus]
MPASPERLTALLAKMNHLELAAAFNDIQREFKIVYTDDSGGSRTFRMPIEPDDLWDRIQVSEADRNALWPDVSVEEASLRLFSVHLLEAVVMAKEGHDVLVKVHGGVRAVPGDRPTRT